MKQLLIVMAGLALFSATATAVAADRQIQEKRILSAVNSLRSEKEAEVLNIGPMAMLLVKAAGNIAVADDPDARAGLSLIRGLKRMVVADYEGVEAHVKDRFNKRMSGLLGGCSLLMSISEDGSHTSIYATVSKDGSLLSNFVIFCPDEGALVCLFGTFDVREAMKLMEEGI